LTVAAADFQARWPGIEFIFSYTDQLVDLVREGFDMAVRIGRLADSSLKARKIGQARRFICASPAYLKEFGTPEKAEDLEDLCCLTFRSTPGPNIWQFRRAGKTIDVRAEGRFRANSGVALVRAARLGLGIILVPEWLAGPDIKLGNLVAILERETLSQATTPIYAIHAYQKFVPPKVRVFGDFLAARFGAGYDWQTAPRSVPE